MTVQSANLKFITAVSNWLQQYPKSPIKESDNKDSFKILIDSKSIIEILKLIFDETFSVEINADINDLAIESEQFGIIFRKVLNIYSNKNKFKVKNKLDQFLQIIDFNKLVQGDYFDLTVLCFILFEIGLHGLNRSSTSHSILIISDLNNEDQSQLKSYINDNLDLYVKILSLFKEIESLELQQKFLKQSFASESLKSLSSNETIMLLEKDVRELQSVIKIKDDLIQQLKSFEDNLSLENSQLKFENATLNHDVAALKDLLKEEKQQQVLSRSSSLPRHHDIEEKDNYKEFENDLLKDIIRQKYNHLK